MAPADEWRQRRARRLARARDVRALGRGDRKTPVRYRADELLILTEHDATARAALRRLGHSGIEQADDPGLPASMRRLRVPGMDVAAAARAVRELAAADGDDRVVATPNHVFAATPFEHAGPFDQPEAAAPNAALAGPARDANARVLVLDGGLWPDSPLKRSWYKAAASDYDTDVDSNDDERLDGDIGHMNFIAGVILSRTRNAKLRLQRVLDSFGVCVESDLIAALRKAGGYDIINLSLGGYTLDDQPPLMLTEALAELLSTGDRVVVAAAGNDGEHERPFWPAAYAGRTDEFPWAKQIVAVAAHDGEHLTQWSNTGDWVSLAAPGSGVVSTYLHHEQFPDGWASWSGTSFAAPSVVAAIAEQMREDPSPSRALERVRAGLTSQYRSAPIRVQDPDESDPDPTAIRPELLSAPAHLAGGLGAAPRLGAAAPVLPSQPAAPGGGTATATTAFLAQATRGKATVRMLSAMATATEQRGPYRGLA